MPPSIFLLHRSQDRGYCLGCKFDYSDYYMNFASFVRKSFSFQMLNCFAQPTLNFKSTHKYFRSNVISQQIMPFIYPLLPLSSLLPSPVSEHVNSFMKNRLGQWLKSIFLQFSLNFSKLSSPNLVSQITRTYIIK